MDTTHELFALNYTGDEVNEKLALIDSINNSLKQYATKNDLKDYL
jgi:hypothetical protein